MTNPQIHVPTGAPGGRGGSLIDWFLIRTRYLTIGGAIVAAAAIGYWFYTRSAQIKSGRAEQSLLQAKQAVVQGNEALAQNDLQNVLRRYGSTRAGVEAGLVLAEIHFGKREFQKGIDVLRGVLDKSAARGPCRRFTR
jgi:predicted negative regulator of RcsB-dependent stress response